MTFSNILFFLLLTFLFSFFHTAHTAVPYPARRDLVTPKKQPAKSTSVTPPAGQPKGDEGKGEEPVKSEGKGGEARKGPDAENPTAPASGGGTEGEAGGQTSDEGNTPKSKGEENNQNADTDKGGEAGNPEGATSDANAPIDSAPDGEQGAQSEANGNFTAPEGDPGKSNQTGATGGTAADAGEDTPIASSPKSMHSMWIGWHRVGIIAVAVMMAIGGLVVSKKTGFCRRGSLRYAPVRRDVAVEDADGWNRGWENDDWDEEEGKA